MNPIIVWFVLGAVLMLAELFTPAFVIFFFGVGAWAAALMAALWPGLEREIATFLIISLLSLLLLRRRMVSTFQGRETLAKQNAPNFPHGGRRAEVTRAIAAGGEGEIALGGSFWRAKSTTALEQGAQVKVIAPDPDNELLLIVEPWSS